jgi:hypothetical protein
MRTSKVSGRLRFSPEEHLTTSQVKSYFSKLTNARREQSRSTMSVSSYPDSDSRHMNQFEADDDGQDEENDDDFELLAQESQRQELRFEVNLM